MLSQVKRTLQVLGLVLSNASLIKHTHMHTQLPLATYLSGVYPDLLGPSKGQWSGWNLMTDELRRDARGSGSVVLEGLSPGADAGS